MMRKGAISLCLPLCITTAWLASPAFADHFQPLSPQHTNYGAAQLNYGQTPNSLSVPLKLMNPNHVTQLGAVFVDQSDRGTGALPAAVYVNCVVRRVTPHGSIGIDEDDYYPDLDGDGFPDDVSAYIEVIWASEEPIVIGGGDGATGNDDESASDDATSDDDSGDDNGRNRNKKNKHRHSDRHGTNGPAPVVTRVADGLGGWSHSGRDTPDPQLAHPGLFTLPSNDVVAGQRETAIGCVCDGLVSLGVSTDVFGNFGVVCP